MQPFNKDNTPFRAFFGIRDGKVINIPRYILLHVVAGLASAGIVALLILCVINPMMHLIIRMVTGYHG